MDRLKLNKATPIKLSSSEDYALWKNFKRNVTAVSKQYQFNLDLVERDEPQEPPMEEAQDHALYVYLARCCEREDLQHILGHDNPDSKGTIAWKSLVEFFEPDDLHHKMKAIRDLGSMKAKDATLIMDLVKWWNAYTHIKDMDINADEIIMAMFIEYLPSTAEWATFANVMLEAKPEEEERIASVKTLFDKVKRRAALQRSQRTMKQDTGSFVNAVRSNPTKQKAHANTRATNGNTRATNGTMDTRLGPCPRCGNDHTSRCRVPKNILCNACGQEGHMTKVCPKRARETEGDKSDTPEPKDSSTPTKKVFFLNTIRSANANATGSE
jgi:hypothetical protein